MSLHDLLVRRIETTGPISIADYMADCLLHPQFGYYTTRDPLGAAGDFTTAPEISQMFGELLGLALAQAWIDQGRPAPFVLAELGPGRGTLMADLLRATRGVPGFAEAAQVWLVEASPILRQRQSDRLAGWAPNWADQCADLPAGPLFLVANEFFDALPIRQFQRDGNGWRERRVMVQDGALRFGLGQRQPQPALADRLGDTGDGDLVELCPQAPAIIDEVTHRIATQGGAALVVDYGDWRSKGDTLQALRGHAYADPLDAPGHADLTAHVDFEALARASHCAHTQMVPQGVFLERLGITARAQSLARSLARSGGADQAERIASEHRRLTHPEEMGNLFKGIGFYPAQSAPPSGFVT